MTQSQQLHEDLNFVRHAVERQRRARSPAPILWLWAGYVLAGYVLLDVNPRVGSLFLMIAGPICGLISAWLGARAARDAGERDRAEGRAEALHWAGAFIALVAILAMAAIHPAMRGTLCGQLIVVCIGLVYYLYGVHRDRNFLWLGLVLIAGGVLLSFIPVYPWTCLGVVIALGLVLPTLLRPNHGTQP